MMRTRAASLVVAAGLGLTTGCSGWSGFNFFHRNRDACPVEGFPVESMGCATGDGPMMGGIPPGPMMPGPGALPTGPTPAFPPPPGASGAATSPAPLPRLVPQPDPARPMPYAPGTNQG
jgi:hypothetical protein